MTEDKMDKYRILASEENSTAGLDWLDMLHSGTSVTWREVRRFISCYVYSGPVCPTTGAPYNQAAVLLVKVKEAEKSNPPKQPWDVDDLEDTLRICKMQKEDWTYDGLSRIGATKAFGQATSSKPWAMLSRQYFLSPLIGEGEMRGGYLTVCGIPGKGKSNVTSLIGEMWHEMFPGTEVLANVPVTERPPWLRSAESMEEILAGVADALEAERRWLWILDDAGLAWLRARATTSEAIGLERFIRIVSKYAGSFIFVEQRSEGVPSVIQDFAQDHILIDQVGFALCDYRMAKQPVRNIPKPRVMRYITGETAYFRCKDFPFDRLFSALPEQGQGKTIAARIRAFLEKERKRKEQPRDERTGQMLPKLPFPVSP